MLYKSNQLPNSPLVKYDIKSGFVKISREVLFSRSLCQRNTVRWNRLILNIIKFYKGIISDGRVSVTDARSQETSRAELYTTTLLGGKGGKCTRKRTKVH